MDGRRAGRAGARRGWRPGGGRPACQWGRHTPLSQLDAASTADHVVPSELNWNRADPPAGTDACRSRRPVTNAPEATETPDGSAALKVTTAAGAPAPPVAVIEPTLLTPPLPPPSTTPSRAFT